MSSFRFALTPLAYKHYAGKFEGGEVEFTLADDESNPQTRVLKELVLPLGLHHTVTKQKLRKVQCHFLLVCGQGHTALKMVGYRGDSRVPEGRVSQLSGNVRVWTSSNRPTAPVIFNRIVGHLEQMTREKFEEWEVEFQTCVSRPSD